MKIGVTAPGSSTHFMVRYMMAQAGLKADDASFIGIGAGPTAVAAVRRGEIDALVNVDPVISLLESEKAIRVVADTRTARRHPRRSTAAPIRRRCSISPPAYVQSNATTVQSLVNAFVRGLKWIASHSAEEIAKADAARSMRSATWATVRPLDPEAACRCIRRTAGSAARAPETALKVLREFDPDVQRRHHRSRGDLHRCFRRQGPGAARQ